jgi:hypothetical protein
MSHEQDEREEAADGVDDEAGGLQCCSVGCHEVDDERHRGIGGGAIVLLGYIVTIGGLVWVITDMIRGRS